MAGVVEATIKRGLLNPEYMQPAWRAELEQACSPAAPSPAAVLLPSRPTSWSLAFFCCVSRFRADTAFSPKEIPQICHSWSKRRAECFLAALSSSEGVSQEASCDGRGGDKHM